MKVYNVFKNKKLEYFSRLHTKKKAKTEEILLLFVEEEMKMGYFLLSSQFNWKT